jgi:Trk K+ transport system NAD-binding subunit
MGTKVLEYLKTAGLPVVVVDNCCRPDDSRLQGVRLVCGDCRRREVLEAAGVATARGVLVLTADDLLNISTALMVRTLNSEVRVVLRMFNQHLIGRLGQTVRNVFALSTSLLTAPILALTAMTGQALATFTLDGQAEGRRQIVEVVIGANSHFCERTIREVTVPRDLVAVAHLANRDAKAQAWRTLLDVDPQALLKPGDRLVVCGEPRAVAPLLSITGEGEAPALLWANWFLRMFRVMRRTVVEIDKPVLYCTLILVMVLLVSTVVLRVNMPNRSLAYAFLRSVSLMATSASLQEQDLARAEGMQVFVSVLRIVGAVLFAGFIAIVTQYLIRARLGGAFELRRIPDGGHHIVCGIDTVGFRVIEELVGYGERVVAIEWDPDNHFIGTARRLGAAVIVGDAAVNEVLRQAHAATAHSVIAATNNDLTNLAIALQVREMNPRHRVVLLLSDPQFAQMMHDAAHVQLAASVPALAAPAFLAGLYGDRVLAIFQMDNRLFAVLDVLVQLGDPFVGQSVRVGAVDCSFLPVEVVPAEGSLPGPLATARLSAGDRVVAVVALADLEPLLRRQIAPAAFAVEVTAWPIPAREWLVSQVRILLSLGQEEAEQALLTLPLRLGGRLTRGQAADLKARLVRERVTAAIIQLEKEASPAGTSMQTPS